MWRAEGLAARAGYARLAVISGVGTRRTATARGVVGLVGPPGPRQPAGGPAARMLASVSGSAVEAVTEDGAFARKASSFRGSLDPGGPHPPAAGRYHLYISHACPWANRCHAVLKMKGLEHAVGVSVTHPTWKRTRPEDPADQHCGWAFADPARPFDSGRGVYAAHNCVPDPHEGASFVRDLYDLASGGAYSGTWSVPVLWDTERKTIVNNESSEIMRILTSELNDHAARPGLDLNPPGLRDELDALESWVYDGINNGVYRCGFARSQGAYDEAEQKLFECLQRAEELLETRRYLAGDQITEVDIWLFMTLVRFDEVYVVYFKTNRKCVREYPNLSNYVRDLYQTPGIGESVNMEDIKTHYFTSHPHLNPFGIVPRGPAVDFGAPHDRDRFG